MPRRLHTRLSIGVDDAAVEIRRRPRTAASHVAAVLVSRQHRHLPRGRHREQDTHNLTQPHAHPFFRREAIRFLRLISLVCWLVLRT